MNLTFSKVLCLMENSALIGNKDDNLAVEAIKKGLSLRTNTKPGETFWDDFLKIIGNAKGMSHLLGVSEVQVLKWGDRVRRLYNQELDSRRREELNKNKRNKMINTGDQPGDNSIGQMANGRSPQAGIANVAGNNRDVLGPGNKG